MKRTAQEQHFHPKDRSQIARRRRASLYVYMHLVEHVRSKAGQVR